jgi:hypothetical protein
VLLKTFFIDGKNPSPEPLKRALSTLGVPAEALEIDFELSSPGGYL